MGMNITGESGNYFRSSVWSWRPIHALCEELNHDKKLGLDLSGWHYNDGEGLASQEQCDALAAAIEGYVRGAGSKKYVLETGVSLRVNPETGYFVKPGESGVSPYSTDAAHILEFAKFLRECGGSFEIW